MADYLLKHFDRELICFSVEAGGRTPNVSLQYVDQEALHLMPLGMEVSNEGLACWLRHRKLPQNRANIHSFLAKFGLSANSTMAIIELSKGLSLADCYWVVPKGFEKNFDQCNLFENRFSTVLASLAFTGNGSIVRRSLLSSPEFTTNGMLPKCWRRQSGRICLYKGGTEGASNTGNEPYSEFYAWQIAEVLGVKAIPYTLNRWKSRLCSVCELFTSKERSFVPVGQVVRSGGMQAVINYYAGLGAVYRDMLEDMFVFDAVIANTDRHLGNFGFLVDARSNTLAGPAPLFDHGNALFNYASPLELASRQAFFAYADAQFPACHNDFFSAARACIKPRHREGLRRLLNIRLKRHPRYNLAPKRLTFLEEAVQQRASRLLEGTKQSTCELTFW